MFAGGWSQLKRADLPAFWVLGSPATRVSWLAISALAGLLLSYLCPTAQPAPGSGPAGASTNPMPVMMVRMWAW